MVASRVRCRAASEAASATVRHLLTVPLICIYACLKLVCTDSGPTLVYRIHSSNMGLRYVAYLSNGSRKITLLGLEAYAKPGFWV